MCSEHGFRDCIRSSSMMDFHYPHQKRLPNLVAVERLHQTKSHHWTLQYVNTVPDTVYARVSISTLGIEWSEAFYPSDIAPCNLPS